MLLLPNDERVCTSCAEQFYQELVAYAADACRLHPERVRFAGVINEFNAAMIDLLLPLTPAVCS